MTSQDPRPLCPHNAIHEGQSLGLTGVAGSLPGGIFIVRRAGILYGYRNRCPHTGVNLEWLEHRFLSPGGDYIQCATHGARFRIEDGLCVAGPCAGRSLLPVALYIQEGQVWMDPPGAPAQADPTR